MKTNTFTRIVSGAVLGCLGAAAVYAADARAAPAMRLAQAPMASAPQGQPTPRQRAAMLREWMQASQAQLRNYEWIETTVVTKGGEEKSNVQKRCFYGADGRVQKVVTEQSSTGQSEMPGILPLGRLVNRAEKHEKEEMTTYMQNAVELVHGYIPPDPANIQSAIQAGKLAVQVLDPGRRVQLNIADYLKPGDSMGFEIELPTNRLLGITVSSYLDSTEDPVALNVTMSVLPDGTMYAERSQLDASAKDLSVTVENTGYRRVSR